MLIAIPSRGRANKQTTFQSLLPSIRNSTFICVPFDEQSAYEHIGAELLVTPPEIKGIGPTRQWLLDYAHAQKEDKILMLDDDLVFAIRRHDDPTKFNTCTDQDIEALFADIEFQLDSYPHVSVGAREGGNRRTEKYCDNTRTLRALSYRVDALREYNIRFDTAEFMEDFTVSLELLTRGQTIRSINWMVQNQNGSNLAGGCSIYRTMERQAEAALALKKRFPNFVNVVTKVTKTAWGGQERTDVIIAWKKAYAYGLARRGT